MFQIFQKEVNSFLNSLIGYIVIGVFLTATGLFVWFFKDNVLDYGFADLTSFFQVAPFIFLFLIPAITMRAFAEEFKTGTIELLFTKPLGAWEIVLGKYLASCFLILLSLLPTLLYYYSIYQLGNPQGNIDSAAVMTSYIGLFFLGCVFAALGVFSSSLTDNQVVAFVIGFVMCLILYYGVGKLAELSLMGSFGYILAQIGLDYQFEALSRGLIDSRNILYFLSVIAIALWGTTLKVTQK
ncbi:gliding motility-associated ABC transporter permease subunit GldF [Flectobacillus roseus]|jgi:ABC-2 type transport system permease protein|uniref:Gliding motility-associated ABC transporter permease subunit GldF n=1 Tax=Flectobacillus roseus TaxID=502259 RepID=A0ABT6Y6P4_9BACT|nr:gliding motility-associated ABC transporter permease subunit GldF [Flectobacillus roseus]MDI9858926.1 gliding motility-associated ABC transporter permease subunit GldF [Flectobacillus roseus]MDI9870548.1 gliding motility-associated ABC transporter permease subunit GldF [Flectobacillus roseus]NBA76378.1 gliding motility-associated ABC transporter permease subunit GldF [Emticicia sp. ODNR4P]